MVSIHWFLEFDVLGYRALTYQCLIEISFPCKLHQVSQQKVPVLKADSTKGFVWTGMTKILLDNGEIEQM